MLSRMDGEKGGKDEESLTSRRALPLLCPFCYRRTRDILVEMVRMMLSILRGMMVER